MNKFRYQAVFKCDDSLVIFTGDTANSPEDQLIYVRARLAAAGLDVELQSFVYEPSKPVEPCQEKEDPNQTSE